MKQIKLTDAEVQRFWRYVNVHGPEECWEWIGGLNQDGYGSFRVGERCYSASRIAYLIAHGRIPAGKEVCHSCDRRLCCNANHLFHGSHRRNMQDCIAKGRFRFPPKRSGETNPASKLTEQQVVEIYNATGAQWRIAQRFGIRQGQVSRIKLGQRWAHLTEKLA